MNGFRGRSVALTCILAFGGLLSAGCSAAPAPSPTASSTSPAASASGQAVAKAPSASESASPAASTKGSAPGSRTAVHIAMAGFNLIESVATLAQQDGYYQQQGLDPTVSRLNGSSVTMAALQSGDVQFALTTGEAILLGQTKNLPLLSIAALNRGFTAQLVMSTSYVAAHPLPSGASLQQRSALLKGAKLGWVSVSDEAMTKYLLQSAQVPLSAAQFVKLQNQEAQLAALQQGEVDAIVLSPPQSFEAEAQGSGRIVLSMREVPGLDAVPYIAAVTTRTFAQQHPDTTRAFLAAIEEAVAKIATRSPDILAYERTVYPKSTPAVLEKTLNFIEMAPYEPMSKAQWQTLEQLLELGGEIDKPYSPKEETDWTNRYLPSRPAG